MRNLVGWCIILTAVVLAQEQQQQDTTQKNKINTAIVSDATVDKVKAEIADPSENPVLAEDNVKSDNDAVVTEFSPEVGKADTELVLDSSNNQGSEESEHNHDHETKPEKIEENSENTENAVENSEENSSLRNVCKNDFSCIIFQGHRFRHIVEFDTFR